jgi:hypothetical protein
MLAISSIMLAILHFLGAVWNTTVEDSLSATFNMKNKLWVLLGPFFLLVSKGFRELDRPSETGKMSKIGL